jgi:rhodanese-related sulfurtransferase
MEETKKVADILRSMTFDFFGRGKHKITPESHFKSEDTMFLDVRSSKECETLSFSLVHHMPTRNIPIEEIPDRMNEIPKDKLVGIFCSSGVRATMVYLYLRLFGYENVRIIEGGYNSILEEFKPGKLLKLLEPGK